MRDVEEGAGFGEARSLLDGRLDRARWEALCAWIDGADEGVEERAEYLSAQIDRRPWDERMVCSALLVWRRELLKGNTHPKHRVLRSVSLPDAGGTSRTLRSPHLSGLEEVTLSNPGKRGIMGLMKASCASRLKSVRLIDSVKASLFDRGLGDVGGLPALDSLSLGNGIDPRLHEMVNAPLFSRVRRLDMNFGRRSHDLLAGLEAPALRELTLTTAYAGLFFDKGWVDPWSDLTAVLNLTQTERLEVMRLTSEWRDDIQLGILLGALEDVQVSERPMVLDLTGLVSETPEGAAVVEAHRERLTTGPLASCLGGVMI